MDPLISLRVPGAIEPLAPGDLLVGECQVDAVEPGELTAIEASVLWYTEGKGDEDMDVHYFTRRTPADTLDGDLRSLWRFQAVLPSSPLSYEGVILRIRWCVRVRVFLRGGREFTEQRPFRLGVIEPAPVRA